MEKKIRRTRTLCLVTGILSVLLYAFPVIWYVIQACIEGTLVQSKVSMAFCVTSALVLTLVSLVTKVVYRSKIWLVVLGLYFALSNFAPCLIIVAVTQIVDEIVVSPLHKSLKEKLKIRKEVRDGLREG